MEHYICRPATELPGYMQVQFRVQDGMVINAGQIYVAEYLDGTLGENNYLTFIPEVIDNAAIQTPAIVINNDFEVLPDGRRPDGNPDYTEYDYIPRRSNYGN